MTRWLGGLVLVLLALPAGAAAQDACIEPRLVASTSARVAFNDGIGVVLRDAPNTTTSAVVENLPEGYILTITGEAPTCQDGFLWWAARLSDGRSGYVAEGAGEVGGYFLEPWTVGVDIFIPSNEQVAHYFVDTQGIVQPRPPLPLELRSGTAAELWQSFEFEAAVLQIADVMANCPDQLGNTEPFDTLVFSDPPTAIYPAPGGEQVLIIRDYLIDMPDCEGNTSEKFGSSVVGLLTPAGETVLFPFSQHAEPPPSQYCQPQVGIKLDYPTLISEVVWSQDGRYVALGVRYLRNSAAFPCAFYQVFVVDLASQQVNWVGEGRRLGWGQGGRRLRFLRVERGDPNQPGTERLLSVLPDSSDPLEIFLPGGATWLPGAMDLTNTLLPWTENGDKLLACNGKVYGCTETTTFRIVDSGFEGTPIIAPDAAQLGATLRAVYFVAGDSQLLWLTIQGELFLQPIVGENAGRWNRITTEHPPVLEVMPTPTGIGAVLRFSDGTLGYFDVLMGKVSPLTGL